VLVVVLPPVVFAPAFDRKRLRRLHGFLDEVEEPVNDREVVVPPILFPDQIEQVAGPSQPGGRADIYLITITVPLGGA